MFDALHDELVMGVHVDDLTFEEWRSAFAGALPTSLRELELGQFVPTHPGDQEVAVLLGCKALMQAVAALPHLVSLTVDENVNLSRYSTAAKELFWSYIDEVDSIIQMNG